MPIKYEYMTVNSIITIFLLSFQYMLGKILKICFVMTPG